MRSKPEPAVVSAAVAIEAAALQVPLRCNHCLDSEEGSAVVATTHVTSNLRHQCGNAAVREHVRHAATMKKFYLLLVRMVALSSPPHPSDETFASKPLPTRMAKLKPTLTQSLVLVVRARSGQRSFEALQMPRSTAAEPHEIRNNCSKFHAEVSSLGSKFFCRSERKIRPSARKKNSPLLRHCRGSTSA